MMLAPSGNLASQVSKNFSSTDSLIYVLHFNIDDCQYEGFQTSRIFPFYSSVILGSKQSNLLWWPGTHAVLHQVNLVPENDQFLWQFKKITPAFRKTSMQLTEDNSTISVKVNVFSYYCCRLKRENLENLKYPQIWNPARVLHFYGFFLLPSTILMIYPGRPWPTTFGCFHDRLHADHPDEHCGTLYNVLQTILLWGPGCFLRIHNSWFAKIPLWSWKLWYWNNTVSRFRSISQ